VKFKPNIAELMGKQVKVRGRRVEDVDVIVYATGYRISFPFFTDPALLPDAEHRFPLFKRMMQPGVPNLFFMGLAQPLPTLVNFAEQQAKLAGAYLVGNVPAARAGRDAPGDRRRRGAAPRPYYKSARHTIQVDFGIYVHDLLKEIEKGEKRARSAGNPLPVRRGPRPPARLRWRRSSAKAQPRKARRDTKTGWAGG